LTDSPPALAARALTRRYGSAPAVDTLDLEIPAGQCVALLGPNGAGKSTLLRMFALLLSPSSGDLRIHGEDPARADRAALTRRIGLVSHQTFLYDHLTGFENLLFYARLYGIENPAAAAREGLLQSGLEERGQDLTRAYSRGMQQRLALARAFLHSPDILLLDEPFTGIDREASLRLARRLAAFRAAGGTCVFATHDLESGSSLSDRILVLSSGRLAADRSSRDIDPSSLARLVAGKA
jgi:ABC-type multidrug transport system ATPase subunit